MSLDSVVVRSAGENGFAQQGQVDWVLFGKTAYTATFAVMQRLAQAGIQPITHGAGLALGTQFTFGLTGQNGVNDALSKLQGVPGFDNVLYFGFGYESFVRVIASSQLGVNCVVLCSALSETHSDEVTAWTLAALWEILLFPARYQPSQTQFLALIRACSGVLTSTTFSQTADMMLGDRRHTKMGYWGTQNRAASPDSLAKVLNALFKISRREAEGIKVFGGWECAFIAAMSYWLFNFTAQVFDEDGLQVFTSTDDDRSAQVVIFYQRDGTVLSNDLQLSSMTHILETTSKMWRYDEE